MSTESEKRASKLPCSEVLRRLGEANWRQMYPLLVSYAQLKLNMMRWSSGYPPGGIQAEDLVQEAIESLFSGRRDWKIAKYPNLEVVLKGIIKSLVSHLAKTADNQTRRSLADGWEHEALSESASPEENMAAKDQIAQIEQLLEDDEEAGMVFLFLQEGTKPKEIAEELDKPKKEIYVILRRIRRKIQDNLLDQNEAN